MPIRLNELRTHRRTVEIETVAGVIAITYRLGLVHDEAADVGPERAGSEEEERQYNLVTRQLIAWIEEWDLVDGPDDDPYPVTPEHIAALPTAIKTDLFRGILWDNNSRPTPRRGSLLST